MRQTAKLLGSITLIKGHLRLFGIRIRRVAEKTESYTIFLG